MNKRRDAGVFACAGLGERALTRSGHTDGIRSRYCAFQDAFQLDIPFSQTDIYLACDGKTIRRYKFGRGAHPYDTRHPNIWPIP